MLKNYVESINEILVAFDPEAIIFDEEAQVNEYMSESQLINDKINAYMSVEEIAEVCKNVFDYYFSPNHTAEEFTEIAIQILKEI